MTSRAFLLLVILVIVFYQSCRAVNLSSYKSENDLLDKINLVFKITRTKQNKVIDNTPIDEDVSFYCANKNQNFTKTNLKDTKIILNSKLDPNKSIVLIIHGFRGKWYKSFQEMAVEYLKYMDSNVCVVDWERLAKYDYGTVARRNIYLVADHVSDFIEKLHSIGYKYDDITLVGHSLGAHVAGSVGHNVNGSIDQIIALDPAGPLFTHPLLRDNETRLDLGDAKFVQVIYTTRHQLGIGIPIGHQNFYPNGGVSPQPACNKWYTKLSKDNLVTLRCSHKFAYKLLISSIDPRHEFVGKKCTDHQLYTEILCNSTITDVLGFRSKRIHGDFYLQTSKETPYV